MCLLGKSKTSTIYLNAKPCGGEMHCSFTHAQIENGNRKIEIVINRLIKLMEIKALIYVKSHCGRDLSLKPHEATARVVGRVDPRTKRYIIFYLFQCSSG